MSRNIEKAVYVFIRIAQVLVVLAALVGAVALEQHLFDESINSSVTLEVNDE